MNKNFISLNKVRHGVAMAFIGKGATLDGVTKLEMSKWVSWIMNGSILDAPAPKSGSEGIPLPNIPF